MFHLFDGSFFTILKSVLRLCNCACHYKFIHPCALNHLFLFCQTVLFLKGPNGLFSKVLHAVHQHALGDGERCENRDVVFCSPPYLPCPDEA